MRPLFEGMLAALVAPLFAFALLPPDQTLTITAFAALALVVLISTRSLPVPSTRGVIGIGQRAMQHRDVLDRQPAPRHPCTPGRRRSRAPSVPLAVA